MNTFCSFELQLYAKLIIFNYLMNKVKYDH